MATTVQPERILKELDEKWVAVGKQQDDGVLRACAMTLIAMTEPSAEESPVGEVLALLMREHPSRAIVLNVAPGDEALLETGVSVQCWMPFGKRQQICSEQIEITSSVASLPDVPPVLVALTVPDLPVVLWCRSERLFAVPAFRPLASLADKLIVDLTRVSDPAAALAGLRARGEQGALIADLAWTRLTRWREMTAQVFQDPGCLERIDRIGKLSISYDGPSVPMHALYIAGWIGSSLDWEWTGQGFRGGGRNIEFTMQALRADAPPALRGVVLAGTGWEISISRGEKCTAEVRIGSLVSYLNFPVLTEVNLLSEELSILVRDPIYERSLALADQVARG